MNDKTERELTPEEEAEMLMPIVAVIDENKPYYPNLIEKELSILLHDKTELYGFYGMLKYFNQIGHVAFKNQDHLAIELGLSPKTYRNRRKQLETLGVIGIEKVDEKHLKFYFYHLKTLNDFVFPKNTEERSKYLDKLQAKIHPLTTEDQIMLTANNTRQETLLEVDQKVEEKVKEIKEKEKVKKKAEEKKFPTENYNIVVKAYQKYKGIGLYGPEIARVKRAIKQMFLAGHSPKNIVDCMIYFKEMSVLDENQWMRTWTMETIMKKMPEFKAGKLKTVERMEDQYEDIIVPRK